jgi:hypothetical protein
MASGTPALSAIWALELAPENNGEIAFQSVHDRCTIELEAKVQKNGTRARSRPLVVGWEKKLKLVGANPHLRPWFVLDSQVTGNNMNIFKINGASISPAATRS